MKATELLRQQHQEIKELYARYGQTDDDDEKQALFEELADNLAAHAIVEERLFYPAVYAGDAMRESLRKALEDHLAIKRDLADLLAMLPDEDSFDAQLRDLLEIFERHADEEESDVMLRAEQTLSAGALDRLGTDMEILFEDVMNEGPSDTIPLEAEQSLSFK